MGNFIKYSLDFLNENTDSNQEHLNLLLDSLLSLFINRIDENQISYKDERLYYVNLITQKFMLHGFSIKALTGGVNLESTSKEFKTKVTDPFSVYSLIRTLIETYLVQNYLSNQLIEKDTLEGRFEIWMRYGLKQRRIEAENEEEKSVLEKDKMSIEKLENRIKDRLFYKKLTSDKKASFLKTINKEWKIDLKGEKFHPLSWKQLIKQSGVKDGINDQVYNFLSWHAHTQSISILQLKNMWDNEFDKISILIALNKVNMFIAFMISDIVRADEGYILAYNKLNSELKEIVKFYNLAFRGKEFIIEKI